MKRARSLATGLAPVAASVLKIRAAEDIKPPQKETSKTATRFYNLLLRPFLTLAAFLWDTALSWMHSLVRFRSSDDYLDIRHSTSMSSSKGGAQKTRSLKLPRESLASLAMTSTLQNPIDNCDINDSQSGEAYCSLKCNRSGIRRRKRCSNATPPDEMDGYHDSNLSLDFRQQQLHRKKSGGSDLSSDIEGLSIEYDNSWRSLQSGTEDTINFNNHTKSEIIQGTIFIPSISTTASSLTSPTSTMTASSVVDSVSHVTSTELSRLLQTRQWEKAMEHLEQQAQIEIDIQVPRLGKCRGYPLHLACLYQPTPLVVRRLIAAFPEAVRMAKEYTYHQLPLHFACMSSASKEVLELLLRAYPLGVKCRESYAGFLPLHLACYKEAPLYVIEQLVTAYPEALRIEDHFGETPIDIAIKRCGESSSDLLLFLEQSFTQFLKSAESKTRDLHFQSPPSAAGTYDVCIVGVYLILPSPKKKIKSVTRSILAPRPICTFIVIAIPDLAAQTYPSWKTVYRSPAVCNTSNPIWTPSGINLEFLCNGDFSMAVQVRVHKSSKGDPDSSSKPVGDDDNIIGTIETTFKNLLEKKCAIVSRNLESMKGDSFVLKSRVGKKSCGYVMVLEGTPRDDLLVGVE
mmetsp:Transcript_19125/g.27199  ORF Transcript_19125/g.27199 Transcript_19125/m.27199 type:complete len:629 (+) Transcript_19125:216-2102(+)|eukprot:CAMPEP_0172414210 /NCGR_PEP_ID=MMETSP1064-20121228/895_1 /TAXON_ID=202472 /ORGANISM="Aulacoseira subarctica , Strain CCAP 1002/5" /LENGTH=628 /DNA_ID=CAMNT_0013150775 /DNA_START=122 /DNA_END=2008 /DNA_ORIENTATION=-